MGGHARDDCVLVGGGMPGVACVCDGMDGCVGVHECECVYVCCV